MAQTHDYALYVLALRIEGVINNRCLILFDSERVVSCLSSKARLAHMLVVVFLSQ